MKETKLTRITKQEAADMLNLNEMTLSSLLQQGLLSEIGTVYKTDSGNLRYLIYKEDVERYIKNKKEE